MEIKELADKLAQQHGTRNPLRIAEDMGYIIIETPLKEVRGYYQHIHKCHIIYIDNHLSEHEKRWVCAHELGHSLLHNGLNRIFMDNHTYMITSRYELEADKFAVDLLFSDYDMKNLLGYSTTTVAKCLDVSYELAEYRLRNIAF